MRKQSKRGFVSCGKLIGWIELGKHDIQDCHLSDRTVAHAGRYHDAHSGMHGNDIFIELHSRIGAAFKKVVSLGEPLVIVEFGVG